MTDRSWSVRSSDRGFVATFFCDTPAATLKQLRYAQTKGYETVTVSDPDGTAVTEDQLVALVSDVESAAAPASMPAEA